MTKIIALYFPQLHPIPENDKWWGQGFTDWVNVKKAQPLYLDHYQPRVPFNHNYYDQSEEQTIRSQVKLAKEYGIFGFCHYHYWFDGKQLLETPTNIFLANKDIDIKFCLAWANETWSKRWDGQDHHILQLQTHPPEIERWSLHFDYLIKAWTDERAIKVDGKPVFLIYRPQKIKEIKKMLDYWQMRAQEYGLKGIYFVTINQYQLPKEKILQCFDAVMMFQPFVAAFNLKNSTIPLWRKLLSKVERRLPQFAQESFISLSSIIKRQNSNSITIYDYEEVWQQIINMEYDTNLPIFSGAFVDWDNTARYGDRATIFKGANPDRFEFWLNKLVQKVEQRPVEEQFIFVNAWNEWAESAYLEPDQKYGLEYLEAIRTVLINSAKR
jgi:hypothetical protein